MSTRFALLISGILLWGGAGQHAFASTAAMRENALVYEIDQFLKHGDALGFRVLFKKNLKKPVSAAGWTRVYRVLLENSDVVGFDLPLLWARRIPARSDFDQAIDQADQKMLAKDFQGAFTLYQGALSQLKTMRSQGRKLEADALSPYILHSMGRSLFGAQRLQDAWSVYAWISPSYPAYRQVLFERMWTAFRMGRVDYALGAIGSQRSLFFSEHLHPESYLIAGYIYKKLCRKAELTQLFGEMDRFERALRSGNREAWLGFDARARVFHTITQQGKARYQTSSVLEAERQAERKRLEELLGRAFLAQRTPLLEKLKMIRAYLSLANVADAMTQLKPVERIGSRQQLLKMDLEVWPVDSDESWADEIGKHVYLGESQCASQK